jgi:hypothetical protein
MSETIQKLLGDVSVQHNGIDNSTSNGTKDATTAESINTGISDAPDRVKFAWVSLFARIGEVRLETDCRW